MANRNSVNLNINPCKMCMPMGAVTAFKGIEKSMMILHGSQGCSTYIRRHMTGHYNEPIDVASSSLTENGTVFGGEKNLLTGLKNVMHQYSPKIIGIATTCLAETIGEDIERMVNKFNHDNKISDVRLVPISTPGYGGSHTDGYSAAILSLVRHLSNKKEPNGKINIITSSMSPADTRMLKDVLNSFEADYILLPDNSDTLDAPYEKEYRLIPEGGTPISDIELMAGAKATIELGVTLDDSSSAGEYLFRKFGVPLYRCALPTGIQNTDIFLKLLSYLSEKPIPDFLNRQRGRYVDAMIDSHKFNAEIKALIFGEPELVYAITRLCMESGIKPLVISTGSHNEKLAELISAEPHEKPIVLDDTDFETLEKLASGHEVNILIGNSDGKVITEHLGIPLVRVGFPIHDRVGGQRLESIFYEGSLRLMDEITNTYLDSKHMSYRKSMFDSFYKSELKTSPQKEEAVKEVSDKASELERKTREHPCFGKGACQFARLHIPVAPACNISCNYCNRKYDCVNESRPGVTSSVLSPEEAKERFLLAKSKLDNLKVVGIAGPGDALANIEKTRESIRLIREADPDITFCLSTNGLMLPYYADELVDLGVTHFTVTINAVDLDILARIYHDINFMGQKLEGEAGLRILLENQMMGLKLLAKRDMVVKVNIVMIKGINDHHIEKVVEAVKECGVYMTNIMPLIPAKGSRFEDLPQTSGAEINQMRKKCGAILHQMTHCRQCRADAAGTLDKDICHELSLNTAAVDVKKNPVGRIPSGKDELKSPENKFRVAVTSKSGFIVDQHFGQAKEFAIYEVSDEKTGFLETKRVSQKYCAGEEACEQEDNKMQRIMEAIYDCDGVITMRIGEKPSELLKQQGIEVIQTCGKIEDCLNEAFIRLNGSVGQEPAMKAL